MSAETAVQREETGIVLAALADMFGNRYSASASVCEQHGRGEAYYEVAPPDGVVFVQSTEEVASVVKLCAEHQVPVIPFGTGTSLEGHTQALMGGVCIDLSMMNQVVEVNAEDMDVTVQAGVTRKALNEYLRDTGLFFPLDPGADASLGGMAATRASGTNAVRYGTMRENVLALTVVLADGRIIRTSRRSRKSAAGYDLTRLFVGSEGTLGVITEVTLRVYGIPDAISAAVCAFPSIEDAVNTVITTIQMGVPVARIELLDADQLDAVNQYSGLDYAVAPTLFFEFHGTERGVAEQAEQVQAVAGEYGATDFRWSTLVEERSKLWQARHDAYYAGLAMRPGCKAFSSDVCVPISRLAECITETYKDLEKSELYCPIVGHVGDGNFHVLFIFDPEKPEQLEEAKALNERIVHRALAMDGTCTGEHGIGYGKKHFLTAEHGGDAVSVMRSLKLALDPQNIMNPGKIVSV